MQLLPAVALSLVAVEEAGEEVFGQSLLAQRAAALDPFLLAGVAAVALVEELAVMAPTATFHDVEPAEGEVEPTPRMAMAELVVMVVFQVAEEAVVVAVGEMLEMVETAVIAVVAK